MPVSTILSTESVQSKLRVKDGGSFYTPLWLALRTTELSVKNAGYRKLPRMIDPACGDGVFLCAFVDCMRRAFPRSSILSLLQQIHGVDLDEAAVKKAQRNLMAHVASMMNLSDVENARAIVSEQIRRADISEVFSPRTKTPEFLRTNQFDLIIGNPPWRINRDRRDYDLENGQWNFSRKTTDDLIQAKTDWRSSGREKQFAEKDIYLLFLRAYETLLKNFGTIGVILPDSFLLTSCAGPYRARLVEGAATYIEGYLNSGKAFSIDSRKKFQIVVSTKSKSTSLACSFGNRAGRHGIMSALARPVRLAKSELLSIRDGGPIPDLRGDAELDVFRSIRAFSEVLESIRPTSTSRKLAGSKSLIRGADIQYGKSLISGSSDEVVQYAVVWRKVSKDDNTRTLLASIIKDNQPTDTNSVHRISNLDFGSALSLFAVLNSSPAEFYMKCLMTVNLTRELIYSLPIPELTSPEVATAAFICGKEVFDFDSHALATRFGQPLARSATRLINASSAKGEFRALAVADYLISRAYELPPSKLKVLLNGRFRKFLDSFPDFEAVLNALLPPSENSSWQWRKAA